MIMQFIIIASGVSSVLWENVQQSNLRRLYTDRQTDSHQTDKQQQQLPKNKYRMTQKAVVS